VTSACQKANLFCRLNYGVSFPVFSKIGVNGSGAHPLYQYLTAQKPGPKGPEIQWNFTKFLIDKAMHPADG
jgi:glutathione peroxidase